MRQACHPETRDVDSLRWRVGVDRVHFRRPRVVAATAPESEHQPQLRRAIYSLGVIRRRLDRLWGWEIFRRYLGRKRDGVGARGGSVAGDGLIVCVLSL